MAKITQKRLKELLQYNPETGVFHSLVDRGGKLKVGDVIGRKVKRGHTIYLIVTLDYRQYYLHRLAWLYVYNEWPPLLDHKSRDGADNRISNLRPCTDSQNQANKPRPINNTTGFKGVTISRGGRYSAKIRKNKKDFCLGTFDTPQEAHEIYKAAAIKIFGDFAHAG